jgi:hypothetical protein
MNLNLSQLGRGVIYKYIVVVMLYEIVLRHARESVVIYSNRGYMHVHSTFPVVFSFGCEFSHFFNLKIMISIHGRNFEKTVPLICQIYNFKNF